MLWRLRHRLLPLAGYELLAGLRSPAGLATVAACCVAGLVVGGTEGATPALISYRVARVGAILLGFLCLPVLSAAARRDAITQAADAIQSRPHQAHELLAARWLGNWLLLLVMLAVVAVFAFAAQGVFGGPLAEGAGPRVSLWAVGSSILAGALPLVFLSVLAYCVAELLQNALAVAIVGVYWLFVLLGRDYLSRAFDFSLTQNAAVYLLLSAGVLLAAMAAARWRQGLGNARRMDIPALALAALLAGTLLAVHQARTRHDPPLHADPVTVTVASQSIRKERLPGFWLPDQHGRRVRLHEFEGGPVVVGFWSPAVPKSVQVLADLERVRDLYGSRGVAVVAVCIADDMAAARRFARASGHGFPMVTDEGTHWAEALQQSSPLAEAYELRELPTVFVGDATRRLVQRIDPSVTSQLSTLRAALDGLVGGKGG